MSLRQDSISAVATSLSPSARPDSAGSSLGSSDPGSSNIGPSLVDRKFFNRSSLTTLLHLVCIASFALFMFWGLEGRAPINGDDIHVLQIANHPPAHYQYDYLTWTRARRHVVGLLCTEYNLAGKSVETANLIWLAVYVASAFACYVYLRKVFSPVVALTGAVAYLTYSSKYEPLTWWSAGAYTFIWLTFFALLRLFESNLSFRIKSVLTAAVILASMYIYEVFFCLVPVFSALLLVRRKREMHRLTRSDWMFASLPIVVLIIHVATLASSPTPIYAGGMTSVVEGIPLVKRVALGFTSALDATCGPKHQRIVKQAYHAYRDFYEKDTPWLKAFQWSAVALFVLGIAAAFKSSIRVSPNMVAVREQALIGAAALFVSAVIGFVSNFCTTPSRLTGIPSIGLMILVCAGLETLIWFAWRSSGRRRIATSIILAGLLIVVLGRSVREGQAFSSLLRQSGQISAFDLDLARKLQALHPVAAKGDELYVRMQRAPLEVVGCWRNFISGFSTGRANESMWFLYDIETNIMNLTCTPERFPGEAERMQAIVENWAKTGLDKVFPFYIDNHNRNVIPMKEIILTDREDHELKRIDFSAKFNNFPRDKQLSQRIPILALPENF